MTVAASGEDWDAVAAAIQSRLDETRATQMQIASRAKVSLTTLRELQHNLNPRRRRPQTLSAVSEALGWPSGHLAQVLRGDTAGTDPAASSQNTTLERLEDELGQLRARVADLEQRLNKEA